MSSILHKKSILQKTAAVGSSTLLSRLFGIVREVLTVRYLGAGLVSDAFLTAYKIPNSLRKIFAEGALSAAYIPTFVHMIKRDDKREIDGVMSLSMIIIQGFLSVLCLLMVWRADLVMRIIAPGWYESGDVASSWMGIHLPAAWLGLGEPLEQVAYAIPFLRILMCIIIFISSSWLLASALQAVNHFFIPAFSPVLVNLVFVAGLVIGLWLDIPVSSPFLSYMIVLATFLQFALHLHMYLKLGFNFGAITAKTWHYFWQIFKKFFPVMIAMSAMEIGNFIDTSFASYLPQGSVSLIYYANRFMGIPLGVFATAFATILLPHFSRISAYAPSRLSFYLLETSKFIAWVTIPVALMMGFFAEKVFITLFLSKKFTILQVHEASTILIAFLVGLFFASFNKILLNIYYALQNTRVPAIISAFTILSNIILNSLLIGSLQGTGLALATSLSWMLQTMWFVLCLHYLFDFKIYLAPFLNFCARYAVQLAAVGGAFYGLYRGITWCIEHYAVTLSAALLQGLAFWLWVGPLCLLFFAVIWYTRKYFGVHIYFLD
jgi:putative peptidoglycan lipid II flippase